MQIEICVFYYLLKSKQFGHDPLIFRKHIAPEGWHFPSKEVWDTLVLTLGDNCNERLKNGDGWQSDQEITAFFQRRKKRMEVSNDDDQVDSNNDVPFLTWLESMQDLTKNDLQKEELAEENDLNNFENENDQREKIVPPLSNDTGFTALPARARGRIGNAFFAINDSAYWWTSSAFEDEDMEDQAYFVLLYEHDSTLQVGSFTDKKAGYSVRCIRNK